jgi:hypothetical protein
MMQAASVRVFSLRETLAPYSWKNVDYLEEVVISY